jgi:hypothetical protein
MLLGQHYNHLEQIAKYAPGGSVGKVASPIQASRNFGRAPPPPPTTLLSLYQELGPSRHFPLAAWARNTLATSDLHNIHVWSLHLTKKTTISLSTFHVDANGHLTCPIWANIEEVMFL